MKRFAILLSVFVLAGCDAADGPQCWDAGVKKLVTRIYQENRVPDATEFKVYDIVEEGIESGIHSCSAKMDYSIGDESETIDIEYTVRALRAEHGPIIRVQFTNVKD